MRGSVLIATMMAVLAVMFEGAGAPSAVGGNIPPLYRDEWWTSSDYGYGYGYDYYDPYGDYGYVAPGVPQWDAEWFPARSYEYSNWEDMSGWFRGGSYLSYDEAVVIAARTEAVLGRRNVGAAFGEHLSVRGRITGLGDDFVGKLQKDHLLVGLRTQRGETYYADLGPATALLQQMGVGEGREATVSGAVDRSGEPALIRADTIEIGGRTFVIRALRRVVLTGRVADEMELEVVGREERHLAVLLDTGRGKLAVNLGPAAESRLSVRKGAVLTVEGRLDAIENNAFLTANHVQVGR
jgi:hypothetical protein